MTNNIFIALGTNVGERRKNLENAIAALQTENILHLEQSSHVYESEPWGYLDQDNFLNMVIQGSTAYSPIGLLNKLKSLEIILGRSPTFHYGPRVIDMDILFFADQIVNTPTLKIPHPEMKNRDFVLFPLCEINPFFIHPQTKQPVYFMLEKLPESKIQLLDYPEIKTDVLLKLILDPPALRKHLQSSHK